jgi:hypothetical protein
VVPAVELRAKVLRTRLGAPPLNATGEKLFGAGPATPKLVEYRWSTCDANEFV